MGKFSNWQPCNCGNNSEMHLICEGTDSNYTDEASEWSDYTYRTLKCLNCNKITILKYIEYQDDYTTPGDFDYFDQDNKCVTQQVLYAPNRSRNAAIPTNIVDVLNQAEDVYRVSPRAGFILCRAVLEEVCHDYKIPKQGKYKEKDLWQLHTRLNKLVDQEQLSEDLKEILYGIKKLGNEGAHGSQIELADSITVEDVEHLIDLVDYILDRLYVDKASKEEAINKLKSLKSKVLRT